MSRALATREHVVYRLFDRHGRLLYVGMTHDLPKRLDRHRATKHWWADVDAARTTTIAHPSHDLAAVAEVCAITTEGPLHNRRATRHVNPGKAGKVMRSLRVPEKLWDAAKAKADEREENISDVIREALERYVRKSKREAENDLVTTTVTTRHPDHYVLVNEHDGTRWQLTPDGRWIRATPAATEQEAGR